MDLPALMALRVQGVASAHRLAAALGVSEVDAVARARALASSGQAEERSGRLSGFALTQAGHDALEKAIDAEDLFGDATLTELYERFVPLDGRLKRIATDWQVRRHGPAEVPNDHSDADYDQSVIDRLRELHDRAAVILGRMTDRCSRLAPYRARLEDCVRRLEAGDRSALTAPLAESYHTVWFELHEDLLLTLGIDRPE